MYQILEMCAFISFIYLKIIVMEIVILFHTCRGSLLDLKSV